jgi:hypothetical protein
VYSDSERRGLIPHLETNYEYTGGSSWPVTVVEMFKACTDFARSQAGIVGSNPTQSMDVWCVYVFILCLCGPVFR